MKDKSYSSDGEYYYCDADSAIDSLCVEWPVKVGEIYTIYEGDTIPQKASMFVGNLTEIMTDCALDNCGEYCESWTLDLSKNHKAFEKAVGEFIDEYCEKNNLQPAFHMVENIIERKIRITGDDVCDWEFVEDEIIGE